MIFLCFLLNTGCKSNSSHSDEWMLINLAKNPSVVQAHFRAIDDPIERTMRVMTLVEQYPNRTRPLCDVLPANVAIERCHRLTERPHLWKDQRNHFAENKDITPSTHLSERTCNLSPHPNTCWTAQALQDSLNLETAIDACQQISEQQWRAECYFTLAEHINTADRFSEALQLCEQSQQFQKSCWLHVVLDQAQQSVNHTDSWDWFYQIDTAIQNTSSIPESFRGDLADHFWAQGTWRLWDANLLSVMPTPPNPAHSTVTDLYSIELLRWCDFAVQNIEHWGKLVMSRDTTCTRRPKPRGLDLESDVWKHTEPPAGCTNRSFLGQSHRIHCPNDPLLDAKLSLLEVSVRLRPMPKTFLQESSATTGVLQRRANTLSAMDLHAPPDRR